MEEEQELVKGSKTLVGSEEVSTKLELTIDEVIEGYVGSLGFSQILHVFLVSLAWIFDSQSTLVTIFSDAQPQAWRCKTELCLRKNSIAKSSGSVCGLDYGTWEWVDGHTSSTIAEWNLICDHRFLAAIPPSLYFLGSLIGSVVYGHLADSWLGRKRTLQLSCMLASITSYATSLSTNLWIYALFRFSNGLARSGIGICCLVLATESVGRKWRGQVGQYGFFFFTIGFLTLPLIAYPTRTSWRDLYKLLSLFPLAYSILLLPFVSESPRWLLIRGRTEEALDVLNKFAKLNGKKNLPKNLSLLNPFEDNENGTNQNSEKGLWTTKWAAYRMIIVMITGFGVGFVYYGIQLNVENLNFNLYISVSLNALMEIPAVLLGSFLLARTNRRLLFSFSCYIAGVSCIICSFYSNKRKSSTSKLDEHIVGENWTQLIIESIGFMAASIAFDVLYVYCVELFPTSVRNLSVSMLRQGLMLGASVSPLLVVFGRLSPSFSFLTFGTSSIVSGLLSIWLPETRNAPLYETLRQQEEIEKFNLVCDDSGLELGK